MAILAHLLGMVICLISGSGLGFVAPLVIWLMKKDESLFIAQHAKQAMIFQIALVVLTLIVAIVGFGFSCITFGLGIPLLILAGVAVTVIAIVLPVIAAVEANKGSMYRYPVVGNLF